MHTKSAHIAETTHAKQLCGGFAEKIKAEIMYTWYSTIRSSEYFILYAGVTTRVGSKESVP